MVLLLQNTLLSKSSAFFAMPMISTTILQSPTNGLLTVKWIHASIVVEIIDSIDVMSLVIRIVLHRTRLCLKKRETMPQVVVAIVEDILVVVKMIKAQEITKRTSLKWLTLFISIAMWSSVLMDFGWLFVASVSHGVVIPMPTMLVFMMLLF